MSRRVLVIDFDPENRQSTESLLADRGLEVFSAGSLAQLERALESSHPDVCLIEPALPGVDGFEICRSICDGDAPPKLIVASTNLRGDEAKAKAREAGAELYFERPIRDRELVDAVVEAVAELEAEEHRQAASAAIDEPEIPTVDVDNASAGGTVELAELADEEFDGWLDDAFDALLPADKSAATVERTGPKSLRDEEEELLALASNLKPQADTTVRKQKTAAVAPEVQPKLSPRSALPTEAVEAARGTSRISKELSKEVMAEGPATEAAPQLARAGAVPPAPKVRPAGTLSKPAPKKVADALGTDAAGKVVEQVAQLTRGLMRDSERRPRPDGAQARAHGAAQTSVAMGRLRSAPLASEEVPDRGRLPMIAAGVAGALVLAAGIGYFAFRDSGAPEEISRATSSTTRSEPAPEGIALAPARPPIESAPGAALEPGRDAGGAPSSEETAAVTTEQSPIEIDGHESTADETRAVSNSRSQTPFSATGDEPAAASVVAAGQRSEPIRRPAKTEPPRVETSSPSHVGTRPPTDPQPEPRVETIAPARQPEATTPTDEPATQPSADPAADAETAALQGTPSPVEPPATQPVEEQRLEAELPPAVPDGPVKMEMVDGSFDVEPQLIPDSRVAPRYPMAAQRMGLGGTVVLQAMILADGSVGDVRIVEDPGAKAGLGKAAATAVRKWRYKPAVRNGEPVDAPLRIRVSFKVK